jgi:nucleotide-binding universal stress UspA family protein
MIEARRAEHKKQLAELLARFPLDTLPHQVHLLKWPAAVAIDHVARAHRADLIIMGTVGRTGLAGFFIGNTAEEVLRESRCAVLAVKPPGFVSPIQWPAAG